MQTTQYNLDNQTSNDDKETTYVVHHHGECSGQAIWTIEQDFKRVAEAGATIEGVQNAALLLSELPMNNVISIGGVEFELAGIINILRELAFERLQLALEEGASKISLADVIDMEEAVADL